MRGAGPVVAVSGYYGFGNLGDEAVLYSMLQALRASLPGARFVVLSGDPAGTRAAFGVEAVNRWSPAAVCRALAACDVFLSGGGSLLQDVTGLKSLLYYAGVIWLAGALRKPVVFYAQGIGPVTTEAGRRLVRRVAERARLITVRDGESAAELRHLGVKRPPVVVTADPVLGLDPAAVGGEKGEAVLAEVGAAGRPVVGVALREWPGFGAEQEEALARVLDGLCRRGLAVVFIPLHFPADLGVSRRVAARMAEPAAVVSRALSVEEALSLFGCLHLCLGMRLHALVFAAVFNVPLVGLSYDPKVERFLARINWRPPLPAGAFDFAALSREVEEVLAGHEAAREKLRLAVEPLKAQARLTPRLVRDLLTSRACPRGA
ncbi:polysaccharide pyruvyl transferase CsaB [Desulfovirgula thermocuniculi]|uniref:polysaccharide pyruvyl transferase CsaB n=1 Tax=Desulfovirgula thermocuniculi TaxID=348842 RepID=UPI00040D2D22|nr:polysaccharide pyruvyl transferase CsaB [Desulfovirgula thermocuniculi]